MSETSRLDRIERLMETCISNHVAFSEEHKKLLTAQVVLTDRIDKLAQSQQETTEKLNALIEVVDGIVKRPPPA